MISPSISSLLSLPLSGSHFEGFMESFGSQMIESLGEMAICMSPSPFINPLGIMSHAIPDHPRKDFFDPSSSQDGEEGIIILVPSLYPNTPSNLGMIIPDGTGIFTILSGSEIIGFVPVLDIHEDSLMSPDRIVSMIDGMFNVWEEERKEKMSPE